MADYRFLTVWWTPAVADRVWEALANYATWPTWWRGIRSVEVLRRGDESGVGTVLRQRWRSRVPYTLVFDLEMLRIEGGRLLDGRASGDLEGTCRWTLAPVNGGTELRFDVDVRTGRWWMDLPIPLAPRVVRSSFETIMRWGREGLARTLGVPVELRSTDGGERRSLEQVAAGVEEQSSHTLLPPNSSPEPIWPALSLDTSLGLARRLSSRPLGDLPLRVIKAGIRPADDYPPDAVWNEVQNKLAALSSNSRLIVVDTSGHFVQLEQPDLVIDTVRQVYDETLQSVQRLMRADQRAIPGGAS